LRYKQLIIVVLSVAVVLAACGGASAQPEAVGDPERGREIFEDRDRTRCVWCHTLDGSVRVGPSLQGISERAGDRVPGLSAVEYLRQSILDPPAYIVDGFDIKMQTYELVPEEVDTLVPSMFTQEELSDLIAFLLTQ
jgi:cytochrome c oxidase subunit 2